MTTRRQTTGRSANEDLLLLDAFKRLKRLNRRIMPYLHNKVKGQLDEIVLGLVSEALQAFLQIMEKILG